MRILLLNQFVPPDSAPTSRLLADLAEAFTAAGWEPILVGAHAGYHQGRQKGWRRLLRDATAHLKLLWAGLRAGPCDWVICLSDPPALPFTAALLARLKRAQLAHWAMDVYPQIAVALGALPAGWASRWVGAAMRFGYREAELLVALDEDMRHRIAAVTDRPIKVLPPWPPAIQATAAHPPSTAPNSATASPRIWLYSGNLGRAHEYRDLLAAQQFIEQTGGGWRLVFQGGGPLREEAQAEAARLGLTDCEWLGYAEDEHLLQRLQQADVLIATQRPSTQGLLWPSKLALMLLLDQPILFVGPNPSQISQLLGAHSPSHGVFSPGQSAEIASWLRQLPAKSVPCSPSTITERVTALRNLGVQTWIQWLA